MATPLDEVWNTQHPTFAKIKREKGIVVATATISKEVVYLSELTGASLTELQIEYLVDYINTNYSYFTHADMKALIKQMLENKQYGKPNLNVIIVAIQDYDKQRTQYAIDKNIKESKGQNDQYLTDEQIKKFYKAAKNFKPNKQGIGTKLKKRMDMTVKIHFGDKIIKVKESELYEKAQKLYDDFPAIDFKAEVNGRTVKLTELVPKQ